MFTELDEFLEEIRTAGIRALVYLIAIAIALGMLMFAIRHAYADEPQLEMSVGECKKGICVVPAQMLIEAAALLNRCNEEMKHYQRMSMPTLRELQAEFIRYEGDNLMHTDGVTFQQADAVMFLCPLCFKANGGSRGTHRVICNAPHVPQSPHRVGPGRWMLKGTGIDDLTLDGATPSAARSVLLQGGCGWHGFVTNGVAE